MQHGIICPVTQLDRFAPASNFHLILPHLFDTYPEYVSFYKNRAAQGDFILVDNDLFEKGVCTDYKEVLAKAELVGASEVVAPEVWGDAKSSLVLIEEFLEYKKQIGSTMKVLAIAQGKNEEEIVESFFKLNSMEGIDSLGLPFMLDYEIPYVTTGIESKTLKRVLNRWHLVDTISLEAEISSEALGTSISIKPTHLFGLSDAVELQKYKTGEYYWIRSNDSSSAFVHGVNEILYTSRGLPCEKISAKLDFGGYRELTPKQIDCVLFNIKKILDWC